MNQILSYAGAGEPLAGHAPPSSSSHVPAAGLLQMLVDTSVIHPDDWDDLSKEDQRQLAAVSPREALLDRLIETRLLNTYQAERIKAGSLSSLVMGNYRVLGSLGAGAGAVVFDAEHIFMRRRVALKVFPVKLDECHTPIIRFLREMRAIARLDHPNIVAAFDAGTCVAHQPGEADLYYFAMERLTGQDLEQYVQGSPPAIATACSLIYQVASALDEAHQHQLVHRDVKPSNIFVMQNGQAKLLDFGLVRHALGAGLTLPDVVVGTLNYMAPEQAFDPTQVDIRSDIFSLGAVLFFALTGASPFPVQDNLMEAVMKRRHQQPLSARSLRPDVPEDLEKVLARLLALRPEDRYPTPQAVMHALLPFLDNHGLGHSQELSALPAANHDMGPALSALKAPRVLIVNAHADQRRQFARALAAANVQSLEATDADSMFAILRTEPTEAVLVAADLPGANGETILSALRENPPCPNLQVLLTSSSGAADEMAKLLLAGADDYLRLPITPVQLAARVKSALSHKDAQDRQDRLSRQLLDMNAELERSLGARTTDAVQARNALVLALARLVEYRSLEAHSHLTRMQRYCTTLAQEAAGITAFADQIDPDFLQNIECCAPLHDIGNVGLPDHILLKAGRLDDKEIRIMQTHTTVGADTLQHVAHRFGAKLGFLSMAIDITRHHHENYDGSGYPDRLAGNNIPLAARILTIADSYDSLRSRRAQRPSLSHPSSLQIMFDNSPGKYDPLLMAALKRCAGQFERIFRDLPDTITID